MRTSLLLSLLVLAAAAHAAPSGLPDAATTPGAANPLVTQANISRTICVPNWTKTVRPPATYTNRLKLAQLRDGPYKAASSVNPRLYEEDHLISIELGGHPRDPKNLWPQLWDGAAGAHTKDVLENRLHRLVCARKVTLDEAQKCIASDWQACAKRYPK